MPVTESVEWNGVIWKRYPEAKKRNHRVYYQHHFNAGTPAYLHREIYKAHHGSIPEKGVIHHKDEDPSNNGIDNLECVTPAEHRKRHAGHCTDKMRANLAKLRDKAAAWHGSPEGLAWHSANAIRAYAKRSYNDHVCKTCAKVFQTRAKSSMYCSPLCGSRARGPKEPKHEQTCLQCCKGFRSLKKTQRYCSYSCSTSSRPFAFGRRPGGPVMRGHAKLAEDTVREIRRDLASGAKRKALAEKHGVSRGTIRLIAIGKIWVGVV